MASVAEGGHADVFVNVYDITPPWLNVALSAAGVGVYHTGIEVYGKEHGFGRSIEDSGVYSIVPKSYSAHCYKESVHLGRTRWSRGEVDHLLRRLGQLWRTDKYHVLRRNCNDFSDCLSELLLSGSPSARPFPMWVNRPCRIGAWLLPDPVTERVDAIDFEIFLKWKEEQLKLQCHRPSGEAAGAEGADGTQWLPCDPLDGTADGRDDECPGSCPQSDDART
eukprot:TRINITY_DN6635_c0_g1_i2.p1 TRINITY_DN6635_c0_g1~~TRINITY_DN6635_c0_g1_i2.p1  ORF type:complete len:222 (+),score=34.01 TRINITY_DN6635_c0_g1_i2:122-787(+)